MFGTLKNCVPGLARRFERLSDEAGQYIYDAAEMSGYSFQSLVNDPYRAPNRLEQQLDRARRTVIGTVQPWARNASNWLASMVNTRIAAGPRRNGNNATLQPAEFLPEESLFAACLPDDPLPAAQQQSGPEPPDDGSNGEEFDLVSLLSSEPPFDQEPAPANWDEVNNELDDEPSELDISVANKHESMLTEQSLSRFLGFSDFLDGSYMHSSVEDYVLNVDDQNNYASADFAAVAENSVVEGKSVNNNITESSVVENVVTTSCANRQPAGTPNILPPRPQMSARTCSQATTEDDSHAGSSETTRCSSVHSLGSVFTLVGESDADTEEEYSYFVI